MELTSFWFKQKVLTRFLSQQFIKMLLNVPLFEWQMIIFLVLVLCQGDRKFFMTLQIQKKVFHDFHNNQVCCKFEFAPKRFYMLVRIFWHSYTFCLVLCSFSVSNKKVSCFCLFHQRPRSFRFYFFVNQKLIKPFITFSVKRIFW